MLLNDKKGSPDTKMNEDSDSGHEDEESNSSNESSIQTIDNEEDSKKRFDEANKIENLFLSVSVADTGCGMNREIKRKCFTLFGNLKFKKDINQGGMGLGLASANLICKALQGELNLIRSEEDNGSKFQFTIVMRLGKEIPKKPIAETEEFNTSSANDELVEEL